MTKLIIKIPRYWDHDLCDRFLVKLKEWKDNPDQVLVVRDDVEVSLVEEKFDKTNDLEEIRVFKVKEMDKK